LDYIHTVKTASGAGSSGVHAV